MLSNDLSRPTRERMLRARMAYSSRVHPSWELPDGQSDRGLANFLSSLRVFSNLIHVENMKPPEQDAVLHIIYLLTRFPPAVRAVRILMHRGTPEDPDKAALVQAIDGLLKAVVPLPIIKNDPRRFLEGSRLLFGLVLEKAKHLKIIAQNQEERLNYVDSIRTLELRNMITMEPVVAPVQTISGLVDRGFYQAFTRDGILRFTNGTDTTMATIDRQLSRAAWLSGGVKLQVVRFDIDAANNARYPATVKEVITAAELADLHHLVTLCSRNNLGVLLPSSLHSAEAPVLTLDRDGLLAVYVGRQACGAAGRDITMFRPTSEPVEVSVDVSIISQLIDRIVQKRDADGTSVFEAFRVQNRILKDPDEVIMLCVDCSSSMGRRCGFPDVEESEDALENVALASAESEQVFKEDSRFDSPSLIDLQIFLNKHESWEDFLAIISTGTSDFHRQSNADKVLEVLCRLERRKVEERTQSLEATRRSGTAYTYHRVAIDLEREVGTLKNRVIRLEHLKDLLCVYLVDHAGKAENLEDSVPLTWVLGDPIPQVPKKVSIVHKSPKFKVPAEYICPITGELMEDPVTTTDNFTYDRKSIERWLQTHDTSPHTNLVLHSTLLRPNGQVKQAIMTFRHGSDILSKYVPRGVGTRYRTRQISVTLRWGHKSSSISVPHTISLRDLYQLAFRITQGHFETFDLRCGTAVLPSSDNPASKYLAGNNDVLINSTMDSASQSNDFEALCLVKIYRSTIEPAVISYWELKNTAKTIGSTIFRYYRHGFYQNHSTSVKDLIIPKVALENNGDRRYHSRTPYHWGYLAGFFTEEHATGALVDESATQDTRVGLGRRKATEPFVFKLLLAKPSRDQTRPRFTRMEVLKQMFDAFVNRILAYNFQTHMGLITFRSTATITQPITHAIENFRHQLSGMRHSGDTALWDSIALAQDQLKTYAKKYPTAKLRIICISDGDDTVSEKKAHDVSFQLTRDRILVDSFCLGKAKNRHLITLSGLTGGYKFQPYNLEEAMAIRELEPVLSQLERPVVALPIQATAHMNDPVFRFHMASFGIFNIDEVTPDSFPRRREHPKLSESFTEIRHIARTSDMGKRTDGNPRTRRILSEIRNCSAKDHPHYDIYICDSTMNVWKIVMQGPPESTYANGTFLLYLERGDNYPAFPPKGRFVTPIHHPNINRHGRICHSIFDRNWTLDTTTKNVIDTIYSLLLVPEFSDPINAVVTLNYHWDQVQFKEEAQAHIQKHASKTRAEWRQEIDSVR
ncbi:hypothetical protein BDV95DRAFT_203345 [Massariosphaeria phaeospora]|uniref:peptidylprolyl isomerase n=1 Tax=Massariosphaeria phaeospora TaxID=100035 RepID=A0A7C8I460_9PLEO|nr:hypothetical protein BDV95DRAFT_203345 [Massariosphaeria phaeospora]